MRELRQRVRAKIVVMKLNGCVSYLIHQTELLVLEVLFHNRGMYPGQ